MTRAFRRIAFGLAAAAAGLLTGCAALQAVTEAGTAVAVGAGVMTPEQAQSANNAMATAAKAAETLTPEQEYYVGRAVGATLLATYRPANAPPATRYLNTLGQALALVSDLPQTFGGYHFLILDADEVPAWIAAGHQVVDVRAAERFRGESEPVDPVAGHIPGAKNLPLSELQNPDGTFLSSDELARRMAFLSAGDALSCGSGLTASLVFLAASVAGVDGLRLYPGSWSDWISDPTRPVAGLTT